MSADDILRQTASLRAIQASVLKSFGQHRTIVDIVTKAQDGDRHTISAIIKGNYGRSEQARKEFAGIECELVVSEQTRKVLAGITGDSGVSEHVRRALDSIIARPAYAEMAGVNKTLWQITSQPGFASMIAAPTVPRSAWAGTLERVREPIGEELYADALATFDLANDVAGEGDGETWWLTRLDPVVLLGLLIVTLQSLDMIGQAVVSLAGTDAPSEYEDGAQILFALATAAYAFIAARATLPARQQPG